MRMCTTSPSRSLSIAGAIVAVLAVAAPVYAQTSRALPQPPVPEILTMREFLLTCYPELADRPLTIDVKRVGREVTIAAGDAINPLDRARGAAPVPLVAGVVETDEAGQVASFTATGLLLDDGRLRTLRDEIAANPSWKEADADERLTRAGARSSFDGAADPSRRLDTEKLAAHLGPNLRVVGSRFQWRDDPSAVTGALSANPGWVVELESTSDAAVARRYRVELDPFSGRIRRMVRQ